MILVNLENRGYIGDDELGVYSPATCRLTHSTPSNLMGCSMPIFHAISLVHSKFQAIPFFRKGMFFKFED
ncbi:MAG: hypothetical protein ABW185_02570, partial [Sedimenticola sp.]